MKRVVLLTALLWSPTDAQTFEDFLNRVNAAPESLRTAIVDSFMIAVPGFPYAEHDTSVHFIYRGGAGSVTVPGDANNWSTSAHPMTRLATTDFWYRTFAFESDARLDYKFFVDGAWILDPRNPRTIRGGYGPNSELRMPRYIPPPEIEFEDSIGHGALRDTSIVSTNLGESRTVRVYTPPGYETSTDAYPLILFHDGSDYIDLASARNVLDYLIAHNRIRAAIAVFVPPRDRTNEYAGNRQNQFTAFIVHEVLPFVDARYRTQRVASSRAMIGPSYGGNISLFIGYTHPEAFGNVAAQSSYIQSSLVTGFQSSDRLNLKLYLDLGTYDIPLLLPMVRGFIPILAAKGYDYRYAEYHEGHSWGNWRAHIRGALEFFLPGPGLTVSETPLEGRRFHLAQNYPNPFNPSTTFTFSVPSPSLVVLRVYNTLGQEVATVVNEHRKAGVYRQVWNAGGRASGMYLYRLTAGALAETRKMLLLR